MGKPLQQDLLAASWSAEPLTAEETRRAAAVGIEVGDVSDHRWPVKWALIRQEIARLEGRADG